MSEQDKTAGRGSSSATGLLNALGMTDRDATIGIGCGGYIVYLRGPWKMPKLTEWEGWPVRYERMADDMRSTIDELKVADLERRVAELERLVAKPVTQVGALIGAQGCVCPVGAEATCRGPGCPRQPWRITSNVSS